MVYYSVKKLAKSFDNNLIIHNISFDIQKGEVIAFIGKSGVGKSTLFDVLAGFEQADFGEIFLNGKKITKDKKNISYMMQKSLLLEHLTVLQNICLPLTLQKVSKTDAQNSSMKVLKEFDLFEHKDKYPCQLSGGMKQRVSFLRAYLKNGDIMLLDEPFAAVDSITKHYIYNWFKNFIDKREQTIIFITHDITEAIILADKVFILNGNPSSIVYALEIDKFEKNKEGFLTSAKFREYYSKIIEQINF